MGVNSNKRTTPIFLAALRTAIGRTPLWFLTYMVTFLLPLVLVVPWMDWTESATQHRYAPKSVLASMDETFRQDHGDALEALRDSLGTSAAFLAFLMMMVGVFTAGGWLQVFLERTEGHSVRRFLWGGAKYFWRFLRVWFLTLLCLCLITWVLHGWPWNFVLDLLFDAPDGNLEVVTSEWTAVWFEWIQAGAFAVSVALLLAGGDYARTRMALHNGKSALWASLCTFFMILVHPIRTLRPLALILMVEIVIIGLIGIASWSRNAQLGVETGAGQLLLLFALGQAAVMWQVICRAARYSAAVKVSRKLVAPLAQPDPWAERIGGPGGPQYPIDPSDDYGVSI